ncbi:hypothetical protein LTR53_010470 [Teratosphaeriaceae sp. CCFEE 6253]|nr:hypothetical protein LTR53_010470 [Teratosphaeriaceae sp. CCFEE 6253]
MSQYAQSRYDDDEPRRYHSVRTRPRERDEPEYVREETYIERGKGTGPRDLVFRGNRDDSVEDIPRDFPPPRGDARRPGGGGGGGYDDYAASAAPTRRAKSTRGGKYDDYSDDDRYTDYGAAAAGGAAGYAAGRRAEKKSSRRRGDRDYESDYSDSRSPPRRRKSPERKKSGIAEALEGFGLGGIAGAVLGNKKKDRSRSSSRGGKSVRSGRSRSRVNRRRGYSSDECSRSRSRPRDKRQTERKWAQAAQAALVAGAVEAFRNRKEPGPWTGDKGKRMATAALAAGGIDGLLDRDPDQKNKRHLAEAVIGGLAANRLANGARSKSRGRGDRAYSPDSAATGATGFRARSRSVIDRFRGRSASRPRGAGGEEGGGGGIGALKGLAGGAAVAAAGKAIYDRVRSKSRARRSRSRSSSADSYVPSRQRRRDHGQDRRSPQSGTDDRSSRAARSQAGTGRARAGGTDGSSTAAGAAAGGGAAGAGAGALATSREAPESDSSSTTDIEKKRKHMRGKELLTAGLATIATIHAAHGVYSSMEAHEKRHRLVAEGEMSPEEARKKQTKAWVQDAAAVGIAALGIKGAFSEWKEMNEQRREVHEIENRKRERAKKKDRRERDEEQQRQEQMMKLWGTNPMMAMGMQGMQQGGMKMPIMPARMLEQQGYQPQQRGGGYAPPPTDNSGNPYAPREGR